MAEYVPMKNCIGILVLSFAFTLIVCGQTINTCAAFQQLVKTTYNFKPSQLSDAQREIKSKEMDKVWDKVKVDPKNLLPCLRQEINNPNADRWFHFDGSLLLVQSDPSHESKAIQVRSFSAVDLDDVDLRVWLTILVRRGVEGFDVSEAGSRWLAYPKAKYYLPEHGAYEVNAANGALFIFGSMDEAQATPALLKIIKQTNSPNREIALWLLVNQATPDSLRALKQINPAEFSSKAQQNLRKLLNNSLLLTSRPQPKTSREEFQQAFQGIVRGDWNKFDKLVEKVPDGEKDVVAVMRKEDLPLIRKVRRIIIAKANPEAIEFYNSFTQILWTLVQKLEMSEQTSDDVRLEATAKFNLPLNAHR
ncbi:MAG: hypothetical protein NVSMB56_04960 [Pyrinomonadaceae bacterium]